MGGTAYKTLVHSSLEDLKYFEKCKTKWYILDRDYLGVQSELAVGGVWLTD